MDDDAEFRDIIIKNLEEKGVLQGIRAKLRAHIYNLVDANQSPGVAESANNQTATIGLGEDESIALSLVQDLLESLNLSYTSSVLRSELRQTYAHWPRRRIAEVLQLDLDETTTTSTDADSSNNGTRDPNLSDAAKPPAPDVGDVGEPQSGTAETADDSQVMTTTQVAASGHWPQTPLLVEILRRLPKTTDESTASKTEDDEDEEEEQEQEQVEQDSVADASGRSVVEDDINSETFVALSRSANLTSESL